MQVSNSSVVRPWKLEQTIQGKLRGRPPGPQAYEIEAKQYDQEWTLFWSSKRKKKQARKMGLPR